MDMTGLDRRLQAQLLAGRRVEGDRLVLADTVLLAALDGSRPLTAGERAALQASPLTTRRLKVLAGQRRAATSAAPHGWRGSTGMLRAADGGVALDTLATDDGAWRLHFVQDRVILQLDPQSRLAATLLRGFQSRPQLLRVIDGAGATVLQGQLDSDGECEGPWPFPEPPARHFQQHGARFSVEPDGG